MHIHKGEGGRGWGRGWERGWGRGWGRRGRVGGGVGGGGVGVVVRWSHGVDARQSNSEFKMS